MYIWDHIAQVRERLLERRASPLTLPDRADVRSLFWWISQQQEQIDGLAEQRDAANAALEAAGLEAVRAGIAALTPPPAPKAPQKGA